MSPIEQGHARRRRAAGEEGQAKRRDLTPYRLPARVTGFSEDAPSHMIWIHLCYPDNRLQGFGGLLLQHPEHKRMFWAGIYETLGTRKIVGKECCALIAFPEFNATVEGIENPYTHKRFTLTGFLRKIGIKRDPLADRIETLKARIERNEQAAQDTKRELSNVEKVFVDWSRR